MSFWLINVIQYTAIVTILDRNNLLKYCKNIVKDKRTPNWQIHLEENINNIRRKIPFITLITNSQNGSAELTKHQRNRNDGTVAQNGTPFYPNYRN